MTEPYINGPYKNAEGWGVYLPFISFGLLGALVVGGLLWWLVF